MKTCPICGRDCRNPGNFMVHLADTHGWLSGKKIGDLKHYMGCPCGFTARDYNDIATHIQSCEVAQDTLLLQVMTHGEYLP